MFKHLLRFILFLFFIISINKQVFPQTWNWAKNIGSAKKYFQILQNDDGTFFYYGTFIDSITIDAHTFYSKGRGWDMFLSKLDASGNYIWGTSFGGPDDIESSPIESFNLVINSNGDLILAGSFADTLIVNNDTLISKRLWQDAFLAKCDPNGNFLWIKHLSAAAAEGFYKPILDNNDNIFVGGGYIDYDTIDTLIYLNHEIPTDTFILPYFGNIDGFFFKFDTDGNPLWLNNWGGPENENTNNYEMDNSGSIYLCESFDSTTFDGNDTLQAIGGDVVIRKYDSNGQRKWVRQYGNIKRDFFGISKIIDNKIFISGLIDSITTIGNTTINAIGYNDSYFAYLDTSGALISIKNFKGPMIFNASPGIMNSNGDIYKTVSSLFDTLQFDSITVFPTGFSSNHIVVFDSSFNAKKLIRGSEIGDTVRFENIFCLDNNIIITGSFSNTATFSGTSLNCDTICNKNFIASYNLTNSIEEILLKKTFKIYPNPSSGEFKIEINSLNSGKLEMKIFSVLGNEVFIKNQKIQQGINTFSINEVRLKQGIYFVSLKINESDFITQKLILE